MTWNAFKNRVEILRTSGPINDDASDDDASGDRDSFVRRIKAVLAA